jgi:hypothetical protein
MKRTLIKTPFRYYDNGIDEWMEGDEKDEFLNQLAFHIGWIVIEFNSLEDSINWYIKEMLSDCESKDETVYLFLSSMTIGQKVDLLIRLYGQWVFREYELIELREKLKTLEFRLKDAIQKRNKYVHGNWSEVYKGNVIKVKTEAKKDGVYHTFQKFDEEDMNEDFQLIESLHQEIDEFDDAFNNKMHHYSDFILIFSYGSNMYSKRLIQRVPSAKIIGKGKLAGFRLAFSKISKDESGKATIIKSDSKADFVLGTICLISKDEKPLLDKVEGLGHGYNETFVQIETDTKESIIANTYIADINSIDNELKPYSWYSKLVIEGAKEHDLGKKYINLIESFETIEDSNKVREEKELSVFK